MISALLLSAGESRRFGSPKALAEINSEKVIKRVSTTLLSSQVNEVIIVLGCEADRIKPFLLNHKMVKVVYNKDYNFGQTSSFLEGLKAVSDSAHGVFLLPVDYPFIKTATIDSLINIFEEYDHQKIVIPSFNKHKGHPPLFPMILKKEFLQLDYTQGINTVARQHQELTKIIEVDDPGVTASYNTPDEFNRLKKELQ